MEKRTVPIQFKVTQSEKEEIQNVVDELKEKKYQETVNISELARQGIEKWIYIYRKLEEGNSLCFLPINKELIENKRAMLEIEDLLFKNENLCEHTKKVLSRVVSSLEWQVLAELDKKYPNHKGLFDLSSLETDL